jgi:hypothetical protein
LLSPFENVLSFHGKHYADIFRSQKRHVSDFFTRNSESKVSSSLGSTPTHPEQNMKASRVAMSCQLLEILQHCQAIEFADLLTGNEWRFVLEYPHSGA